MEFKSKEMEGLYYAFEDKQYKFIKRNFGEDKRILDSLEPFVFNKICQKIKEEVRSWVNVKSSSKLYTNITELPGYTIGVQNIYELCDENGKKLFNYILFNTLYQLKSVYPSVNLKIYHDLNYTIYNSQGGQLIFYPRNLKEGLMAECEFKNKYFLSLVEDENIRKKSTINIHFSP